MRRLKNKGNQPGKGKYKPIPYIKKTKLSKEDLPIFKWELRPYNSKAEQFFKKHPMSGARTQLIEEARRNAIDVVLANMHRGMELIIPNFAEIRAEEHGFGRRVFLEILDYLKAPTLIGREGEGFKRSIITYSTSMRHWMPSKVVFQPLSPIRINLKRDENSMRPKDKKDRNGLKQRMRKVWSFYQEYEILPGIDDEIFNLFNNVEVEIEKKPPLIRPDKTKILPEFVFNDRDLTKGGRMYGAFWIGMKSILRRLITIEGDLTADIDGKGMHVQLLYRNKGLTMPDGDPYLFADPEKRKVAKQLMVLMINTQREFGLEEGRKAVQRTYRKHYDEQDGLEDLMLRLEGHHHAITEDFYKPNWGHLQGTEAAIMLSIMERGMEDGVVVLPVHDGCLCPRKHVEKVKRYFDQEGIEAAVNNKHYEVLPIDRYQTALDAVRIMRQAA